LGKVEVDVHGVPVREKRRTILSPAFGEYPWT